MQDLEAVRNDTATQAKKWLNHVLNDDSEYAQKHSLVNSHFTLCETMKSKVLSLATNYDRPKYWPTSFEKSINYTLFLQAPAFEFVYLHKIF